MACGEIQDARWITCQLRERSAALTTSKKAKAVQNLFSDKTMYT